MFGFPDLFNPSACTPKASHCCWHWDHQANNNNSNCANPYDKNFVDEEYFPSLYRWELTLHCRSCSFGSCAFKFLFLTSRHFIKHSHTRRDTCLFLSKIPKCLIVICKSLVRKRKLKVLCVFYQEIDFL